MSETKPQLPLYSIMAWRGTTYISLPQNWLRKILDHYEVRATEQTGLYVVSSRQRREIFLFSIHGKPYSGPIQPRIQGYGGSFHFR